MIKFVLPEKISELIQNHFDKHSNQKGLFLTVKGNKYVAVDNETGDALTENFDNIIDAIDWLNGKININDYLERKKLHA